MRRLRLLERAAWGAGLALLAVYGTARVHGAFMERQETRAFEEARRSVEVRSEESSPQGVDFADWSAGRVRAYRGSLEQPSNPPLAILRIPGVGLEVPVLDGTDEITLNHGVGRIRGTTRPGHAGNIGIAGHRDGFFRVLKDVERGDLLELETLEGVEFYRVEQTLIVDPDAVEVLGPTEQASVTLVTCYPFYFVGSAPQRYIVRAVGPVSPTRDDSESDSRLGFVPAAGD